MNITQLQKIYFIGIGGIGMSALARYFKAEGKEVCGYDKTETTLTRTLVAEGMSIHYEDDISQIPEGVDLVVYTPAVPQSLRELQYFKANDYTVLKRAEVLGLISRSRKTIAGAGTHGKTSTSSILGWILTSAGLGCSAFLGGIAQNFASNFVNGNGEWLVVEADEYDRSFLHLRPKLAIILSMDADHLDIYGSHDSIKEAFATFANYVDEEGKVFIKNGLESGIASAKATVDTYGIDCGSYRAENISVANGFIVFDVKTPVEDIDNIEFTMPGLHNVENATAAIAIAQALGVSGVAIKKALKSFKGIERRFEWVCRGERVYVDDYAHHPTELAVAIQAMKMLFPDEKITGVFQPHLYSRTNDFVDGFAEKLDLLDEIFLLDIYPARELPIPGVTSELIFNKMKSNRKRIVAKAQLLEILRKEKPKILITLGAGDIGAMVPDIKEIMST